MTRLVRLVTGDPNHSAAFEARMSALAAQRKMIEKLPTPCKVFKARPKRRAA
ncbi:hypothetical protein Ga0609869_000824 [Rhodovulum iodosum]|uniref:Uncharacterized protein n=1 Tax=Rhodovulum iodosum TaxID=68291 RepID=A0ABV3XQ63_9RHOB